MKNNYPKLHNAMWPGLVGKGSPGAEPCIDLDTMLDLTARAEVGGVKFDGVDLFLYAPHVDIDIDDDGIKRLAEKIAGLRIFSDADGKMNRSVAEVGGEVLVVSQFTLAGNCSKGKRPSFDTAAPPEEGKRLYEYFVDAVRLLGLPVQTGIFQADMKVHLVNDGPVTFILER